MKKSEEHLFIGDDPHSDHVEKLLTAAVQLKTHQLQRERSVFVLGLTAGVFITMFVLLLLICGPRYPTLNNDIFSSSGELKDQKGNNQVKPPEIVLPPYTEEWVEVHQSFETEWALSEDPEQPEILQSNGKLAGRSETDQSNNIKWLWARDQEDDLLNKIQWTEQSKVVQSNNAEQAEGGQSDTNNKISHKETSLANKPQLQNQMKASSCSITNSDRFDCWPEFYLASQQKCEARGCCWNPSTSGMPSCYYPNDYVSYSVSSFATSYQGMTAKLTRRTASPYPNDVKELQVDIIYQTENIVRFRIIDPNTKRYEVPMNLSTSTKSVPLENADYKVDLQSSPFGILITRRSTGAILFDSRNMAPLVYADQFLQIGTRLASPNIYGLGEHQEHLRLDTNWNKLVIWTRDKGPDGGGNLYGAHPFYLNLEPDGKAHGVFLFSSNALEVALQPYAGGEGSATYRALGGILDFFVFTGPSPVQVVEQYVSLIGRPAMPSFWSLGFHLSQYGYFSTKNLSAVIARNRAAKIPYVPPGINGKTLYSRTACPSAKQALSVHYNMHNMYGWSEMRSTKAGLTRLLGKRSLILSRSSFAGSGRYGAHWTGDNQSRWPDLYYSIPGILNFNMFGVPLVGADICGFNGATTTELCIRWMQLGSFYPFMRNHDSIHQKPQDPASFDSVTLGYMRVALETRYSLLPFMYTWFFLSHTTGTPVVRPLFMLFPNTETIDRQYMWGDSMLISPVLQVNMTKLDAYFPAGLWYDLYNGSLLPTVGEESLVLDAPLSTINAHIRGGSIIPRLLPAVTTDEMRGKPFTLTVAPDQQSSAHGLLYWDDGESLDSIEMNKYSLINFTLMETTLKSTVVVGNYPNMKVNKIIALGVASKPKSITLNGKTISTFSYDASNKVLTVDVTIDLLSPFSLTWILSSAN